ncbi:MAG: threonine/homoserine/homoserine lactone efflux protein [Colwellia sp.]|jgi:threonine/homoserine/homoserine lactone efflux protein
MELHLWLSFVVICIMGALSPGPSLALVIKNTLAGGTSQGYATAISHGLGVALYAAITATGIAVIIVQSPLIFSIIQYAGAAFLLYLGIKSLLSKKDNEVFSEDNTASKSQVNGWRDGFLIAFLNPKLAIFFLALFSQFLGEEASSEQKMIMTATVGSIDALWYCLVTFTLSRGNIISKLRENSHIVDKVTGSFLILLAARIVIS